MEKTIHAFTLLDALASRGLEFVFKQIASHLVGVKFRREEMKVAATQVYWNTSGGLTQSIGAMLAAALAAAPRSEVGKVTDKGGRVAVSSYAATDSAPATVFPIR